MADEQDSNEEQLYPSPSANVPPAPPGAARKVRVPHLLQMKRDGRPIVMVTAYDAMFAQLADEGGVDIILVGDSAGMVVHGYETTLPVTMEMMLLHTAAVSRGGRRAMVVGDMPFMSFQVSVEESIRNAGRFVQEAGAEAVKVEGRNERVLPVIEGIAAAGIPVMGHIGLTPQSVHAFGGFRVQGRGEEAAEALVRLAKAQESAGAFSIVLEAIPVALAERITREIAIPTIGIGAGAACDGQVLVMHDLLGLNDSPPKFNRRYADLRAATLRAFRKFGRDVRERHFPAEGETYG
ncbi:MAG: 3-methyl-2-oxobutanoate hydroxymethyltransferase [Candidatus Sumerlaeia bacterium]|nr:3-methyl-2-oxobutanoate hydroxymethyltransferase [Candidatus Sumerlaeia bacterium]